MDFKIIAITVFKNIEDKCRIHKRAQIYKMNEIDIL